MEFSYSLTGTGWAEARVANGSTYATITASYLEDALGELLRVVRALLDGATDAECSWEEEPGEYRWVFGRTGDDVRLRILVFEDIYSQESNDKGVPVFAYEGPLRQVATAIGDGAQAVLDEYGVEGYKERWGHEFPVEYLEAIQKRLAAQ